MPFAVIVTVVGPGSVGFTEMVTDSLSFWLVLFTLTVTCVVPVNPGAPVNTSASRNPVGFPGERATSGREGTPPGVRGARGRSL